jgi:hypothetical protein
VASPVSSPVSTTVIAFDIAGADSFEGAVLERFDQIVAAAARGLGFVTQEAGKPNLTVTLAPEAALADAVNRTAAALAGFDGAAAPLRVRAIANYGVVFRAEADGQVSFSGSAIRATQSALRRAPDSGSLMATRDFVAQASRLADLPFRFEVMSDAAGAEGLSNVVFGAAGAGPGAGPAGVGFALASNDQAFVAFIKRRLAGEIGPFAGALVDRALRTAPVATQLVKALSREIENPVARAAFEQEVFQFIKNQNRNP